jgi:hypothetical protein
VLRPLLVQLPAPGTNNFDVAVFPWINADSNRRVDRLIENACVPSVAPNTELFTRRYVWATLISRLTGGFASVRLTSMLNHKVGIRSRIG